MARNYGEMLLSFGGKVPDGLVVFFPSYAYLQEVATIWQENGVLEELQMIKLVFVETKDPAEASLAIENYRKGCDSGVSEDAFFP